MASIKQKFLLWSLLLVSIWIVSKSLVPAGRDPLAPNGSALAMRGRNLLTLLAERGMVTNAVDAVSIASSDNFLRTVLDGVPDQLDWAFDKEGCLWNVALHVDADSDADFPVLISANLNPAALVKGSCPIELGPQAGASRSLLDDRAVVVVRMGGHAQVIKKDRLSVFSVFPIEKDKLPRNIEYLTPIGICRVSIGGVK